MIAKTANAFDEDRAACLAAGINDFLSKPVEPEALFRMLSRWLGNASAIERRFHTGSSLGDELLERVSRVDGFDVDHGLASLAGMPQRYLGLLRQFVREHAADGARIRDLAAEGRMAEAAAVAHLLQGMAPSLGAIAVAEAALAVEQVLREPGLRPDAARLRVLGDALHEPDLPS